MLKAVTYSLFRRPVSVRARGSLSLTLLLVLVFPRRCTVLPRDWDPRKDPGSPYGAGVTLGALIFVLHRTSRLFAMSPFCSTGPPCNPCSLLLVTFMLLIAVVDAGSYALSFVPRFSRA